MSFDGKNHILLSDGSGVILMAQTDSIAPDDKILLSVTDSGTAIANSNTFKPSNTGNNICQRSGFKAKPEQLVREWSGGLILPEYAEARNIQDFTRAHAEEQPGTRTPEAVNDFITTRVTQDDL